MGNMNLNLTSMLYKHTFQRKFSDQEKLRQLAIVGIVALGHLGDMPNAARSSSFKTYELSNKTKYALVVTRVTDLPGDTTAYAVVGEKKTGNILLTGQLQM
eukprot:GHVS01024886.1.p1 GENE.GHVS01024886.1~~GHVS01024886.1.p1  ORF type:complete len:101 (-),score=9.36 GHVS01024886.1:181-483(-)